MCTIGNVFSTEGKVRFNTVFKQCDLENAAAFIEPAVAIDKYSGIRYLPFTRKSDDGTSPHAWAGVNEYGVSFVAADSYLKAGSDSGLQYINAPKSSSVFDMYNNIIARYKTAEEATAYAKEFYKLELKGGTDILLIADAESSYFIEAGGGNVIAMCVTERFFASTNHMRMLYGAVEYENNHSTYLRLQRAESILQNSPTHNGVGDVLRDKYFGQSVWSICRSNTLRSKEESPFYTQASVIINVPGVAGESGKRDVSVEYVINGKPDKANIGVLWHPFTSVNQIGIEYIGKGEIK
jgi:hypothetical protein